MRIITLNLGSYGATVVLFHIISVVHLWLGVIMSILVVRAARIVNRQAKLQTSEALGIRKAA